MTEHYSADLGSKYTVEDGDFPMHGDPTQYTAGFKITVLSGDYEGSYVFDFGADEPEAIERILDGEPDEHDG
ncbi:MAG: hypothetical protein GY922_15170 [Proteobacteria bacterium]|nr:hypothetical protein [Pseudomonadota bacterium]